MFEEFPKVRKELPEDFKKIYASHYKKNRGGLTPVTFFSKKMESWMHRKVAEDCPHEKNNSTLEIGAGTLNHLPYENIYHYDIVEPFTDLYKDAQGLSQIQTVYADINEIESSKKYTRIISIANFEHILNLPEVVAKSCLLLADKGTLRVAMPNEGTSLWRLAYALTTGIEFRLKYGLNYATLMKHEHVNTADEIEKVLTYFFKEVKGSYFGISKKIAFYRFYECKLPETNKAQAYLIK